MSTELPNPVHYNVRRSDGEPMQESVPEGTVLAVFAQPGAADQYRAALEASHDEYDIQTFHTVEDVQRFAQRFHRHFDYVIINPEDPQQKPTLQPFYELLEIAQGIGWR